MKVELDKVIEAMVFCDYEFEYFYDCSKEETVLYADYMLTGVDNSELEEALDNNPDNFIALPTKFEIHEYKMMKDFVATLNSELSRVKLYHSLRGKGAFRRFKSTLYTLKLEQAWYSYKDNRYEQMAKEWCQENNITWY